MLLVNWQIDRPRQMIYFRNAVSKYRTCCQDFPYPLLLSLIQQVVKASDVDVHMLLGSDVRLRVDVSHSQVDQDVLSLKQTSGIIPFGQITSDDRRVIAHSRQIKKGELVVGGEQCAEGLTYTSRSSRYGNFHAEYLPKTGESRRLSPS